MKKAFLSGLIVMLLSVSAYADWPDWRGPTADGQSTATKLPLEWSETNNVTWKTAIHDLGHSTPVIWGEQIWLSSATEDGTRLFALCMDKDSGEIIHDVEVLTMETPQRIHPLNSYATPSPIIEEGRVYVHYGSLGTACVDTPSGKVLWQRTDLNCEHMQGPASSPVLFEDLLILHLEGTDKQFIAALDKATGKTVWQYNRPEDFYTPDIKPVYLKSYQTPVIVSVDGQPQLVSNGALLATGHDLSTGKEIWRVRYKDDSTISRIISGHGLLFINTGGPPGGSELWAVRQGGTGDVTDSHVVWKLEGAPSHESSPVLVGDLLYTVHDQGNLICTEAKTGVEVWAERLRGKFGASLLAANGHVYLSNKKGTTTVFKAEREYKEVAVNQLDGELWASPAVTENALILRTKTHLYRIEAAD